MLEVTTSHKKRSYTMEKTGIFVGHGTNPLSVAAIAENGHISASWETHRHEFAGTATGVYCSKLEAPNSPYFREAPFQYSTVSCIFPPGAEKWDLEGGWITEGQDLPEKMRIPLTKFVWILEVTKEGEAHKQRYQAEAIQTGRGAFPSNQTFTCPSYASSLVYLLNIKHRSDTQDFGSIQVNLPISTQCSL